MDAGKRSIIKGLIRMHSFDMLGEALPLNPCPAVRALFSRFLARLPFHARLTGLDWLHARR